MPCSKLRLCVISSLTLAMFLGGCGAPGSAPAAQAPATTMTSPSTSVPTAAQPTAAPTAIPPTPAPSLPGAAGTPVVPLTTPGSSIKIKDLYVSEKPSLFGLGEKPSSLIFPSGIKELYVVVIFESAPPEGTKIDAEVQGASGAVELQDIVFTSSSLENTVTTSLNLTPTNGKFADGPYQATLKVNGTAIALLNWAVGTS